MKFFVRLLDRAPGHRGATAQRGAIAAKLLVALVILILLLAGYLFFVLKWSYSSGERAGWVQKLSHKGWLCKTWEGELSLVAMPGAMPEKFLFTIWDDKVAADLNKQMGRRVSLHYEEKIGIPTDCFGETRYIVTRLVVLEPQPAPSSSAVPAAPESLIVPAAPGQASPANASAPGGDTSAAVPTQPTLGTGTSNGTTGGGSGLRMGGGAAGGGGSSGGSGLSGGLSGGTSSGGGLMLRPAN